MAWYYWVLLAAGCALPWTVALWMALDRDQERILAASGQWAIAGGPSLELSGLDDEYAGGDD